MSRTKPRVQLDDPGPGSRWDVRRPATGLVARALVAVALLVGTTGSLAAADPPRAWVEEWPRTDFGRSSVDLAEIHSGGPPRDGIPPIDDPVFADVGDATELPLDEPVIGLSVDGDARAYPLRILIWHEITNDVVGGIPVAVTYCPLCNAAIVFDRRMDGHTLSFGTTGKLRHSDLVMYDRETESWWQQFLGEAIVGEMTGKALRVLPSRLESFGRFRERHPQGKVQVPGDPELRPYGRNPYTGYDSAVRPFLYAGHLPPDIPAMAYVVAVEGEAWTLDLVRQQRRIQSGDTVITWEPGKRSALDTAAIARGRDLGNVVVQRQTAAGSVDLPYDLTFAFVFHAFRPGAPIHR